jgi:hypothetical protein
MLENSIIKNNVKVRAGSGNFNVIILKFHTVLKIVEKRGNVSSAIIFHNMLKRKLSQETGTIIFLLL